MQPTKGRKVAPFEVHSEGTSEQMDRQIKDGEQAARMAGVNLRVMRTSGKSMVSFFGISKEKWDAAFGKKKGGKGKGK